MVDAKIIVAVRNKYQALGPVLDETVRRRWAACKAMAIGWGGITVVSKAKGISCPTIRGGIDEVHSGTPETKSEPQAHAIRHAGGGRHRLSESNPILLGDLNALLESARRGTSRSPLCWTSKSTRHLAEALAQRGHSVSHHTVARLLSELTYNRKIREGNSHPNRDAQFEHINKQVRAL